MTPPEGPIEAKSSSPKPHYAGHRDRLRKRFARSGDIALEDYELLELLLFRSIPRQDTKPLAKALLERFGSLAATLGAPSELLCEVNGIGLPTAQDLKIVAAVGQRSLKSQVMDQEILNSWNSVVKYCEARMAFETREQFRILFLDRKNALIADEVQQVGTVDHTPAYPREIVSRALALSATAIILVHNHPSGDPAPSDADIAMTRTIVDAGEKLGIKVHDHLIIGKGRHASMKALALI